jgi:hypothetical protein
MGNGEQGEPKLIKAETPFEFLSFGSPVLCRGMRSEWPRMEHGLENFKFEISDLKFIGPCSIRG